jgi:uncharacterized protein involved in exopolysaccharide biosynthesis
MEDEINIVEIINMVKPVFKRKKTIVWCFIIAILIGFLQIRSVPNLYSATLTIMPTSDSGGLFSALSQAAFLGGGGGGDTGKMLVILRSRSLAERLVIRENLLKEFFAKMWDEKQGKWKIPKPPNEQSAASYLLGITKVEFDAKDGLVKIKVSYRDPEVTARIANAYPVVLGEMLSEKSIPVNFRVIDPALVPTFPETKGNNNKSMYMAGFIGLFLGVCLAFGLEYWAKIKKYFEDLSKAD